MYLVLGLGMMKGVDVGINVVEGAKPIAPVPYSFKDKTELKLDYNLWTKAVSNLLNVLAGLLQWYH